MNRWMRSRTDRKIAGVCGGIAQMNGWDSTIVRLVWVALVVFGGTGVLAYLILWVIMPEAPLVLQQGAYPPPAYTGSQPFYPANTAGPVDPNYPGQGPTTGA